MHSASGRSSSCSRVRSDARRRTLRWRGRSGRADRDTATRCAIESKVFSSSRLRPHHVVEQLHVLDGVRQLPPELVGAIEQIELAAGSTRTPSNTTVPSARRQPRSGTVTVEVAATSRRIRGARENLRPRAPHGDRRRRQRIVHARSGCRRLTCSGSDEACSTSAGRADRASRPTCGRRRTGGWRRGRRCRGRRSVAAWQTGSGELVEQLAQIALQLCRAGAGGTARAPSGTRRPSAPSPMPSDAGGAACEADGEQADALAAAGERQQQRRAGAAGGTARSGVCRPRRSASIGAPRANASATIAPLGGAGIQGSVGRSSRPKPEVACMAPLRGLCSNSSEQAPAGHVERCWCSCGSMSTRRGVCASSETSDSGAGAAPALPGIGVGGRPGQAPRSGVSGHLFLGRAGSAGSRIVVHVSPVKSC